MENYKQAMENYNDNEKNAKRRGEHENEDNHITGPLGGEGNKKQVKINSETGTTEEYIHDGEESFRGKEASNTKRDKGGTVSDKDPRGVWHPSDGIPEEESENGLRSMQNNPDTLSDYDEGKP